MAWVIEKATNVKRLLQTNIMFQAIKMYKVSLFLKETNNACNIVRCAFFMVSLFGKQMKKDNYKCQHRINCFLQHVLELQLL